MRVKAPLEPGFKSIEEGRRQALVTVGGESVPYAFGVPLTSLVAGTNTVTFQVANGANSYPPVLTSVDLLTFTGS